MKFAQDNLDEGYVITSYDENSVSINNKAFTESLIISGRKLDESWDLKSINQLADEHIQQLLSFEPELIIIGTGNKLVFPSVEIYSTIINCGIGVDFMDTRAACRTYNVLFSEDRDVVAGIIL
jgi:uncharacterized protein